MRRGSILFFGMFILIFLIKSGKMQDHFRISGKKWKKVGYIYHVLFFLHMKPQLTYYQLYIAELNLTNKQLTMNESMNATLLFPLFFRNSTVILHFPTFYQKYQLDCMYFFKKFFLGIYVYNYKVQLIIETCFCLKNGHFGCVNKRDVLQNGTRQLAQIRKKKRNQA